MNATEKIRSAMIRTVKGLTKRPELAKVHRSVRAKLTDGLTCEIEAEDFRFVADMPEIAGGNAAGASPSCLLEAALASCLAIGFRMICAEREIPLDQVEVEVAGSFDVRGLYGMDGVSPGFEGPLVYTVHVQSPASEAELAAALKTVEAQSPLLNILTKPPVLQRELRHNSAAE